MEQIIKDILEKHGIVRFDSEGRIYIAATAVPSNLNLAIIEIAELQIEMCAKNVPWEETPINNSPNIAKPQ